MLIGFDSHTHTVMSGHAFSTIEEYTVACNRYGLEGFATTDHGPAMMGAPQLIYFYNLASLPRLINGVNVLRGAEANIVDFDGTLDLPDPVLKRLDVCIASYHEIVLPPKTALDHTNAWLAVLKNPFVDIIGHSGRGPFPFDITKVLVACREENKAIEINNHTVSGDSFPHNCRDIALACKKLGVKVAVNSDAHISSSVGQVKDALDLLESIDFPPEMIVNRTFGSFCHWLQERKPWLTMLA